jgi:hypothetical protein
MSIKNKLLIVFFLFSLVSFSQKERVKILRALIVSDSIPVERVTVTNITAETVVITDDLGQFTIFAKEDDVIMITGVAFETKQIVVKSSDFEEMILKIYITEKMNQLDEVNIGPYKLSGDLVYDAKRIKVKPAFKVELEPIDWSNVEITGVKPRAENMFMPPTSNVASIDLIKVGKLITNLFGSSSKKIYVQNKVDLEEFQTEIKKRFSDDFFEKTLKISKTDKQLFIDFCFSEEINEKQLFEISNSLSLMEFMIAKSEAFRKIER